MLKVGIMWNPPPLSSLSVLLVMLVCSRRKAVKATLVLLPLLGITYMLFFVNPGGEDEVAQIVFIYFNSILESFQVLLFCCLHTLTHRQRHSSQILC